MMEICPVAGADSQVQVDAVRTWQTLSDKPPVRQLAPRSAVDVARQHGGPEYATMRQQSQEAYDVAVRSKSASDWAHFLQLRKAKTSK
jgi:hypothetical protein